MTDETHDADPYSDAFFERLTDEGLEDSCRPHADLDEALRDLTGTAASLDVMLLRSMPQVTDMPVALVSFDDMTGALSRAKPTFAFVMSATFDAEAEMLAYDDVDDDSFDEDEIGALRDKWEERDGHVFRLAVGFVHGGVLVQCLLVASWFGDFELEMDVAIEAMTDNGDAE